MLKKNTSYYFSLFLVVLISLLYVVQPLHAATLLTDSFTGTTIDTTKWVEFDSGGTGGTSGNIQQNGTLTIFGSATPTVGTRALVSINAYNPSNLEISANISPGGSPMIGYGDRVYNASGNKAYLLYQSGSNILALVWNNAVLVNNVSCGTATSGATYKIKVTASGFEGYKNGALACTVTPSVGNLVADKPVFLQSDSSTPSTFDNVLVTGDSITLTVPDAPTGLAAIPGNTQVSLSWSVPGSNGGSAITDYIVEYKLTSEPTTWSTFSDGTSTTTSATVTGLSNSLGYDFRVKAVNSIGTGSTSTTASATPTPPTVADPPTGLTITSVADAQVNLSWSAPAYTGGVSITDYTVEYKLTSEPTTWSTFSDGTSTTTTASVTSLVNNSSYDFRVKAVNSIGTSSASSTVTGTPYVITTLMTDSFTGTTIDIAKWVEFDSGGTGGTTGNVQQNGSLSVNNSNVGGEGTNALVTIDTYIFFQLEFSAKISNGGTGLALFGYGDRQWNLTGNKAYILYAAGANLSGLVWNDGLIRNNVSCGTTTNGATYKMKVLPTGFDIYKNDVLMCTVSPSASYLVNNKTIFLESNTASSSYDDFSVSGTLVPDTAPGSPTIGTATAGNAQATVTFTAPALDGGSHITGYTVTSLPGGITSTGSSSPIIITGLTNGISYTFTVTATNAIGTSSPSSASNSVTPFIPPVPEAVTGLVATGMNKQALVGWYAPGSGSTPSDYLIEYKLSSDSTWTTFSDGVSTATKTVVTGLLNDQTYNFRVSGINITGTGASSTTTATTSSITQLTIVFTGESNSGGQATNSPATTDELAPTSEVQILNNTSLTFESLDVGTNNNIDHFGLPCCGTHGLEIALANAAKANTFPDNPQIHLVKTGQGGSTLSQWNVGGNYWTKFLARTAAAKSFISSPKWVVWMSIGINDFIAGTTNSNFKTQLIAHINKIKADLPGAIIILTQFQSMSSNSGYPAYNTIMSEVAASEPNVYVVDTTSASLQDGNHWNYAGFKTVGNRMITITNNALGLIYPGIPTSLNLNPLTTSVSLSWTAPIANGGSSITDYKIEYKKSSDTNWLLFNDGTSTSTNTSVTGLQDATNYDFRVSAMSSNGSGNTVLGSTTTLDGTPPIISLITATPSNNSVIIEWTTNENSSSKVDYGLDSTYGTSTSETDTVSRVTNHTVNISSLNACTTYHYRLHSIDAYSNEVISGDNTFITTGCITPTPSPKTTTTTPSIQGNVCNSESPSGSAFLNTAAPNSSNSVILTFTGGLPATKYLVSYGKQSNSYTNNLEALATNSNGKLSIIISSLEKDTTYYFRIKPINNCAEGNFSNEISTKTNSDFDGDIDFIDSDLQPLGEIEKYCTTYKVKNGDTAVSIAKEFLGDSERYQEIIELNKDNYASLKSSNNLIPGWTLKIKCGYKVNIKVLDLEGNPIKGAKITIHSKVQEGYTDEEGLVKFENVESGEHKIIIAYEDYEGEQTINLTGDVKEFDLTVNVSPTKSFMSIEGYVLIAVLSIIIIGMSVYVFKLKKAKLAL